MDPTPLLYAVGAIATVASSWLVAHYSKKQAVDVAEVDADGKAMERAERIYKSSIDELEQRITRLKKDFSDQLDDMRTEIKTLRGSVSRYEGRTIQLEEALRQNGIPIPPWPTVPAGAADPNQPLAVPTDIE